MNLAIVGILPVPWLIHESWLGQNIRNPQIVAVRREAVLAEWFDFEFADFDGV